MAAEPTVAMTLPSATPTTVPVTPKTEAMTAARTEAAHEARTWIQLIFIGTGRRYPATGEPLSRG